MTVARMPIVALLLLAVTAPAVAKTGPLKLKVPAAGQASLAELTYKGKPPKLTLKGKLPMGVGVVAGSRKLKKGWAQDVVVFRRGASSRAHAAGSTFVFAGQTIAIAFRRQSVLRTFTSPSFLPGGRPLPSAACRTKRFASVSLIPRGIGRGTRPDSLMYGLFGAGCGMAVYEKAPLCALALRGCDSGSTGGGANTPVAWSFTAGPTFSPYANATDILGRDVDGDGFPDLVVGGSAGIELFPGAAGGTFGSPVQVDTSHPWDFVGTGDFNGDGKGDLIGSSSSAGIVQDFLGNGSGGFTPGPAFTFGSGAPLRGLAIGQLNGDTRSDLIVGQNDGQVAVLIGQSSGGFLGNDFPTGIGGALFSLAIADFNADGSPDLVVVGAGPSPKVLVLVNHGDGTFPPATGASLLGAPNDLAAGDFTGDGKPDAAVLEGGNSVIQVFPGVGDGTFGSPLSLDLPSGSGGVRVAAGDVNGDGFQDVLGLNQGAGSVSTFLGQAGGFTAGQSPINSSVGANPVALSLLNFNGDGKLDAAVVNGAGGGGIFLGGP